MHTVPVAFQGLDYLISSSLEITSHTRGAHPKRVIIACHGYGDNINNFALLSKEVPVDNTTWIFAQGPHPVPIGIEGWQWYSLYEPSREHLEQSSKALRTLALDVLNATKCSPKDIFLLGFSQGAFMSLHAAMRLNFPIGGVIGLSGYLAQAHNLTEEERRQCRNLRIFLAHGLYDNVVFPAWHFEALDLLEHAGIGQVQHKTYPIGHEITREEIADVVRFIEEAT